ncbi:hypothetical protein [uncultured Ruegeria sp.]|uniref:hypothetical protein n=1 Tax=uncultured Ruegeria sp. TaxID=259304 RepID=UPI002617F286|nr:hypothetical protein [uncultured Ruegeria sp.]
MHETLLEHRCIGDDVNIGPFNDIANWVLNGTMTSLVLGYSVFDDGQSRVEAFGGLRHWGLDLSTTVAGFTASTDES